MMKPTADEEGERALTALQTKLEALPDVSVMRPSTDPLGAAATALLVADYLGQLGLRAKLAKTSLTPADIDELRQLARAITHVIGKLGGDYLPDAANVPGDLLQRGTNVRTTIGNSLERALPNDENLKVWLEAIRLGTGVVDLVYDLRTLADLVGQHQANEAAAVATVGAAQTALSAADSLEFALRAGDSAENAALRTTITRLWTLFVASYDRAAAAARELSTQTGGRASTFPALALVASHRRARRRPMSLVPPHVVAARKTVVPARRDSLPSKHPSIPPLSPEAARAVASAPKLPSAVPAIPELNDVELIEAEDVLEEADLIRPEPPPAPHESVSEEEHHQGWSDTRNANRHTIEMEVGIASESNFYLGFTENLSAGGMFVATYVLRPIGSKVEVALELPTGESFRVHGVVRWLREGTTDGWPGMGVQFETLTETDEQYIRKFLSLREPMFYDD